MRTTSVTLGAYYDKYVDQKIQEGRFSNPSEMIRCALRLLEREEAQLESLRKAIDEGIESGFLEDVDFEAHLSDLQSYANS
ncbi:MAG: type II toxin-antitoxin system ParD family antitoxin [Bacteroidales bacterium]|nr:type II toxin-antitoxin system ParD family antitoxin [Bacteroidales bacterium]